MLPLIKIFEVDMNASIDSSYSVRHEQLIIYSKAQTQFLVSSYDDWG